MDHIQLRQHQEEILRYQQGWMGVSAVPGSGKTWTLAMLTADIISRDILQEGQEVLVVTLVNSAVEHFSRKVREFLGKRGILPFGFRVRTLHGLAHDIVRERPALAGLPNDFSIIDEHEAGLILTEVAETWLRIHPGEFDQWLSDELDERRKQTTLRNLIPDLLQEIALQFIRFSKDVQVSPEDLTRQLSSLPVELPLAKIGLEMYEDYQRALKYRGAVDFDDLIRYGLFCLKSDAKYLERLQNRWPYILEDEAQDSSRLQEEILQLLAGKGGNWVRVGDPNQAIYETFTTSNPKYLREFLKTPGVVSKELPTSGRSSLSIINLANELVRWTMQKHPVQAAREALYAPPYIEPTGPGDPQPNPPDDLARIHIHMSKLTPLDEIDIVINSLEKWLPDHPKETVAILVPRNQRGVDFSENLKKRGIQVVEKLQSSHQTRQATGALVQVLQYLADPQSAVYLAASFRVWQKYSSRPDIDVKLYNNFYKLLRKIKRTEDYLWPGADYDWLASHEIFLESSLARELAMEFKEIIRRWQAATLLPIDQLLLTISQDLFREPADMALAYKLATLSHRSTQDHPNWRLPEFIKELVLIAKNERKFLGFSQEDLGFNPDEHAGKVVVSTIHRAKGLEWDRVYLVSVNTYDFPGDDENDQFIAEKWFIKEHLNLPVEALGQLRAALFASRLEWYKPGVETRQARLDYIKERLRLLYVGITRARKELVITWNNGRYGNLSPAAALLALGSYWENNQK
jgi:DNA helicase-2/ATP-dependent DNA helicase PcrA